MTWIKRYEMDAAFLLDPEVYARYERMAAPERRAKAAKYKDPQKRCLSLGAGFLLQHALKMQGIHSAEDQIVYSSFGKPFLKDHPDLFFSLSHSKRKILCVVSNHQIGCDIEKIRDMHHTDRLLKHIVSDPAIENCPTDAAALFQIWTMKESWIKMRGDKSLSQMKELPLDFSAIQAFSLTSQPHPHTDSALSLSSQPHPHTDSACFLTCTEQSCSFLGWNHGDDYARACCIAAETQEDMLGWQIDPVEYL